MIKLFVDIWKSLSAVVGNWYQNHASGEEMTKTAGRNSRKHWLLSVLTIAVTACLVAAPVQLRDLVLPPALAQNGASFKADITIHADQPGGTISRNIYGSFSEHLGNGIYYGIWGGVDSPIPNTPR